RVVPRLGAIVDDLADHSRTLQVGVRVGEYGFDSSRFITQDRGAGVVPSLSDLTVPLDDNYDAIRRQIWLSTDAAYKQAVGVFAKKKAAFQNRAATEALADFSKEKPVETLQPVQVSTPTRGQWVDRVKQLSAVFSSASGLDASEVLLSETHGAMYYLNSEGFKSITPVGSAYLRISVDAQAADGATVRDLYTRVESRLDELPPMAELMSRAREVATRAKARRTAVVGE